MKTFVALAVLASAVAAPALADVHSFTREGLTYQYEVKTSGNTQYVSGKDQTGKAFSLTVRNGRVSGVYGGSTVAFAAPKSVEVAAAQSPYATR